jgi:RNA polymerase sigma-70 factor (ECF subfamily)
VARPPLDTSVGVGVGRRAEDGAAVARLDDAALLSAVGVGDERAATVFVHRHQAAVHGVAVAMCGDSRLAEDVAQSTFERAWRHAGSFDPRLGSVRTWLLTICRRLAIDALRLRRSRPIDPASLDALLPPSSAADPTHAAVVGDEMVQVRAALSQLPEPQRRALVLAAMGGHTAAEIAVIEGVPLGTVKTRLRSGLRRVRDLLDASAGGGVT